MHSSITRAAAALLVLIAALSFLPGRAWAAERYAADNEAQAVGSDARAAAESSQRATAGHAQGSSQRATAGHAQGLSQRVSHAERDAIRPLYSATFFLLHAGTTPRRAFDAKTDGVRELRLPTHHATQQRALATTTRQVEHAPAARLQQTGVAAGGTANLPPPISA